MKKETSETLYFKYFETGCYIKPLVYNFGSNVGIYHQKGQTMKQFVARQYLSLFGKIKHLNHIFTN